MRDRAFSLLELLVAMFVTSILMALLFSVLQGLSVATNRTTGRLAAEGEARAALEFLERDIHSSIASADGTGLRVVEDPGTTGSHWLVFLSSPLDHSPEEPGDVCLMSYRVGTSLAEDGTEGIPVLFRLRLDAMRTFDEFHQGAATDLTAIDAESVSFANWLAAGVIGLHVKAWVGGEMVEIVDSSTHNTATWDAVEVTLEVLTSEGRRQYGSRPLADLRKTYAHRFTRRIVLSRATP